MKYITCIQMLNLLRWAQTIQAWYLNSKYKKRKRKKVDIMYVFVFHEMQGAGHLHLNENGPKW